MGIVSNIDAKTFPKQGQLLNQRVKVCFKYDSSIEIGAICVRDDIENPGITIFKLDDGRYVLASECMYGHLNKFNRRTER